MKRLLAVFCLLVSAMTLHAQEAAKLKNSGNDALRAKNYPLALESYEKAYAADAKFIGEDLKTVYNMGICGYKTKNYNKSIKYFTMCFDQGYKGEKACRYMSYCYKKQKDMDNYVSILEKGLAKYPNSLSIKKSLSKHYLIQANGSYSQAIKVLTKANEAVAAGTFKTNEPQYKKAEQEAKKLYEVALPICEKSLSIYPDSPQAKNMKTQIEKGVSDLTK
ncbi:hypothetical protein K4L44_04910 [Halosquirtibacter laminarini]|uniref:Uncharacterized protein n=1 Tax=Halosquirtibacter laminarini TaxID=3374600 RepID=A0AC61NHP3_9BACT|nr:hypothetical protein K4L44_04910 [Prolixibacteraceae bacterium]